MDDKVVQSHVLHDRRKLPLQRPAGGAQLLVLPHLLLVIGLIFTIHGWATEGGEKEEEEEAAEEEEEWEEQEEEGEDDHTPSSSLWTLGRICCYFRHTETQPQKARWEISGPLFPRVESGITTEVGHSQ